MNKPFYFNFSIQPIRLNNKMSTIIEFFELKKIEIIETKNNFWFTSKDIAKGLEIKTKSIWNIFDRHRDILSSHTCILKMGMQDQIREIRVFLRSLQQVI